MPDPPAGIPKHDSNRDQDKRTRRHRAHTGRTETFAAVRLFVDSWRWADVPFYIRAGKNLPAKVTEVLVEFKQPPQAVFSREMAQLSNHVRFRLGPEVSIGVGAHTKLPGEAMSRCLPARMALKRPGRLLIPSWIREITCMSTSQEPGDL